MKNESDERRYILDKELLAAMSERDLGELGVGDVGYVKQRVIDGKTAFVLYAADGTALTAQNDEESAQWNAHYQDLELVTVH